MAYRDNSPFLNAFGDLVAKVKEVKGKHNVHLIVLESFLDPPCFATPNFPVVRHIHPSKPSSSTREGFPVSPVFGGATAQAESIGAVRCSAMRELSGIEFDVHRRQTLCLPNILGQAGYHAMATNAFLPDFFNSPKGTKGRFEKFTTPVSMHAGVEPIS